MKKRGGLKQDVSISAARQSKTPSVRGAKESFCGKSLEKKEGKRTEEINNRCEVYDVARSFNNDDCSV